jgi:hypothetical protein
MSPIPEWRCSVLYQGKNRWQKARASSIEPKRAGKPGRYLRILKWASEYGSSLLVCGRLWLLAMPRSASRSATGRDAIELPRSEWMVS